MLPAKNRLNLSHEFKNRFSGAKRASSEEFLLIANRKQAGFKLAVVISKKVAPKAVDRNRAKRIVSEALKGQAVFFGELLVIVNKNIARLKTEEVYKKLSSLILKLK